METPYLNPEQGLGADREAPTGFAVSPAERLNIPPATEKPHSLRRSCAVANLGQGELTLPAATTPAATSSIVSLRTSLCYLDGSFVYCLAIKLVDGL